LPSGIPNLSLNNLPINVQAPCRELDSNGRFRLETEFILRKPREKIRFTYTWIPDQNNFKEIVIIVVCSVSSRHLCSLFSLVLTSNARENKLWSFFSLKWKLEERSNLDLYARSDQKEGSTGLFVFEFSFPLLLLIIIIIIMGLIFDRFLNFDFYLYLITEFLFIHF
jgi:hypothetical protein